MTVVLGSLLLSEPAKASCVPEPAAWGNTHRNQRGRCKKSDPNRPAGRAMADDQYISLVHSPAPAPASLMLAVIFQELTQIQRPIGLLYTPRRPRPASGPQGNRVKPWARLFPLSLRA